MNKLVKHHIVSIVDRALAADRGDMVTERRMIAQEMLRLAVMDTLEMTELALAITPEGTDPFDTFRAIQERKMLAIRSASCWLNDIGS